MEQSEQQTPPQHETTEPTPGNTDSAQGTEQREVVLVRGASGLGLKIASNDGEAGVRICEVTAGGAAEQTGAVFVGDVIVAVNGSDMLKASHDDVVAALMSSSTLNLKLTKGKRTSSNSSLPKTGGETDDDAAASAASALSAARPPPTYMAATSRNASFATPSTPSASAASASAAAAHAGSESTTGSSARLARTAAGSQDAISNAGSDHHSTGGLQPVPEGITSNKRRVFMSRRANGFGMKIRSDPGIRGVRVSDISPGGAAFAAGNVYVGDFILEINDTPMLYASHDDVVGALLKSSDVLLLLGTEDDAVEYANELTSKPLPGQSERVVRLTRLGTGLGMKIKSDEGVRGVRIIEVTPGGAAEKSGLVMTGDVIVCVNGVYMLDKPHSAVVEALTAGDDEIELTLATEDMIAAKEKKKKGGINKLKKLFSPHKSSSSVNGSSTAGVLADMPPEALAALREIAREEPAHHAHSGAASLDNMSIASMPAAQHRSRDVAAATRDANRIASLESELAATRTALETARAALAKADSDKKNDDRLNEEELRQENAELRFKLVDVEMSRVMDAAEIKRLRSEVEAMKSEMTQLRAAANQLTRIQTLLLDAESSPTETAA